jgi:putative flippase GtrA
VMIKNKTQKATFAAVGVINTAIDFGILFTLKSMGLPVIPSNIISTSAAFCFSFFANRKYTFKATNGNTKREFILFVVVTLFGLWVIQNVIIAAITYLLSGLALPDTVTLFVAKIFAIIASLTWNYIWYSRVVFKPKDSA